MQELVKMVVILTILSAISGGLLAAVRNGTKDQIELQQLKFDKAPAIKLILADVSNDPLKDRFKIKDGENEVSVFVGKSDGKFKYISIEGIGKGFADNVGLMVGIDIAEDKVIGVGVTSHKETPGIGARAKTDPSFAEKFIGLKLEGSEFKVKDDGGQIDAISGATVTSRGVCMALTEVGNVYKRIKPEILKKIESLPDN